MPTTNIYENNLLKTEHIEVIDSTGNSVSKDILLIKEITLKVFLENGHSQELISTLSCLSDKLDELVVGILFSHGLINTYADIESITYSTGENVSAQVCLAKHNDAHINAAPQTEILPQQYKTERIFELANIFAHDTILHQKTSGTHSCLLADNANVYISAEDISRHNTLDKAIGYALINNINLSKCMIFTSARISSEMVCKTVNAGIPILISKSVPTDSSARLARENNLTLICRAGSDYFCKFT